MKGLVQSENVSGGASQNAVSLLFSLVSLSFPSEAPSSSSFASSPTPLHARVRAFGAFRGGAGRAVLTTWPREAYLLPSHLRGPRGHVCICISLCMHACILRSVHVLSRSSMMVRYSCVGKHRSRRRLTWTSCICMRTWTLYMFMYSSHIPMNGTRTVLRGPRTRSRRIRTISHPRGRAYVVLQARAHSCSCIIVATATAPHVPRARAQR